METLYTLSEAQKIGTKIIEEYVNQLQKEIINFKNKSCISTDKETSAYV